MCASDDDRAAYVRVVGHWVHLPEDAVPRAAVDGCAGCTAPAVRTCTVWPKNWWFGSTARDVWPFKVPMCSTCATEQTSRVQYTAGVSVFFYATFGGAFAILAAATGSAAHWVLAGLHLVGITVAMSGIHRRRAKPLFALHARHRSELSIEFRRREAVEPFARANGWDGGERES